MESREVFVLQHWISPRVITGEGYWTFDLDQMFWSLNEAETERDEFHSESVTKIVRSEIVGKEVVTIKNQEAEKREDGLLQLSLFGEK